MAYNIYSDPDLSATSKVFRSFIIDFKATKTPIHTYWALCNFGLYFSEETKELYPGIAGGGAYAGLQLRDDGRKAIMAFWEMTHGEEHTVLRASRVYPKGVESNFGGEGEGTNCIRTYNWKTDHWYRMALHAWEDLETGKTFVGQWICDLETGKWDLISYFNTHLVHAAIRGGMSLFQENYIGGVNQYVEREFYIKNMYVCEYADGAWKSLDSATISYGNGGADNKAGGHSFGATEDYFWGIGGGPVADQEAYEKAAIRRDKFTIRQPQSPSLSTVSLGGMYAEESGMGLNVCWWYNSNSAPQLSARIEAFDKDGNLLACEEKTRPEIRSVLVEEIRNVASVKLTLTDIFGGSVTVAQVL